MLEILTKQEIESKLGKESFWLPERLVGKVHYLSGIKAFDDKLEGMSFKEVTPIINIMKRPKGVQIQMAKNLSWFSIGVDYDKINEVQLEDKEQIIENVEKSVIGRALIGGVLLGPVGAIIGGMSGVGKKEVSADMPELIISFTLSNNACIFFSTKYKDKVLVSDFLKKTFGDKFTVNLTV